ncbi:hypothetical protein [Clostridium sp. UBA4548]|uniref:hypothetical protein n=1 Tax=Clostridium sp. UBA4548 TaxID=1946361 RepID=UPI0025C72F02|nr:hypothetical protein [Clostridium sp. UBA4548]
MPQNKQKQQQKLQNQGQEKSKATSINDTAQPKGSLENGYMHKHPSTKVNQFR